MFRIIEDNDPPIPKDFSDTLVAFLKESLRSVPAQRPSAKRLSQHRWLQWGLDEVGGNQAISP